MTPCRIEACDPRQPYRVNGGEVRFLTFESDQDSDPLDVVEASQVFTQDEDGDRAGDACDAATGCPRRSSR